MNRIGRALWSGMCGAVILLSVAESGSSKAENGCFLFPMFAVSGAAEAEEGEKLSDEKNIGITYSFKLAELFAGLFGERKGG